MSTMPQIKVRTSDDVDFDVSLGVVQKIGLIRSLLELETNENNLPDSEVNDDDNIIYLDRVTSGTFRLVLLWCSQVEGHVQNEYTELGLTLLKNILKQQDVDNSNIFELIIAADYLDIEGLVDMGTSYVAQLLSECYNTQDIRKRFDINESMVFD